MNGSAERPNFAEQILGRKFFYDVSWLPRDAVVYAAAIGAEVGSDLAYLDMTHGPMLMPTFLSSQMMRGGQSADHALGGSVDLHGAFLIGYALDDLGEVLGGGTAVCVREDTAVWDKGSAAVVVGDIEVSVGGAVVTRARTTVMFRGVGGFGGERGPSAVTPPDLSQARELPVSIPANSGVLYQLVGEHNPHSIDPAFAAELGLPGPISAGQVLIGASGRTLTAAFADGDHQALRRISVDFAGSHVIGQPLTMRVQPHSSDAFDFAVYSGNEPVLIRGRAELA